MCPHYTVCPPESTDELNVQLQTIQISTYNAHNSLKEEEEEAEKEEELFERYNTIHCHQLQTYQTSVSVLVP